ncbi:MAG: bifunctional DNA primase/polymerase, partial [Tagaea sp.]
MATVLDVLRSKSEPGDMREAALAWAARGLKVFPIVAGTKTPLVADFPAVATGDPDAVRALWTDPVMGEGWPLPHNVGVLTGGDLLVLDVDTKRGKPGLESLAALELGTPTLTVRTPTGGKHLYFRTDREVANTADHPGPGLDVRGRHGYVLASGSVIDTGRYEIERDGPVATAPPHLLARLAAARERADTTAPATDLDTPDAIERARDFLRTRAPAVEGQGGD